MAKSIKISIMENNRLNKLNVVYEAILSVLFLLLICLFGASIIYLLLPVNEEDRFAKGFGLSMSLGFTGLFSLLLWFISDNKFGKHFFRESLRFWVSRISGIILMFSVAVLIFFPVLAGSFEWLKSLHP